MEQVIGVRKFGSKVDITDPCYDKDVWCRMNGVEILPGEYECFVDVWDNEQTGGWGERVARLGIRRLRSEETVFHQIGEIGVDAGLAGIFEDKKDFTDDEWSELCNSIDRPGEKAWLRDDGFFSSSGYGDGGYPVFAAKNSRGQVVALEIQFIWEEDEEEEDEE